MIHDGSSVKAHNLQFAGENISESDPKGSRIHIKGKR